MKRTENLALAHNNSEHPSEKHNSYKNGVTSNKLSFDVRAGESDATESKSEFLDSMC